MAEEIKIGISAPGAKEAAQDVGALEQRIKGLREEAAKQRGFADQSASKFGFNDVTAKSARTSAASMESEANRLEQPARAARKAEAATERNEKASALRQQRAQERTANQERTADERSLQQEKDRAENNRVRVFREQQREEKKTSAEGKLGFLGGMSGLNAVAAVTGIVAHVVKQFVDFNVESAHRSAAIASGGIVAANTTDQIAKTPGPRGEEMAMADFQEKRSALEKLENQRGSISDVPESYLDMAKSGLKERLGVDLDETAASIKKHTGIDLGDNLGETSADRARRELKEKIGSAKVAVTNAKKQTEHKFRDGLGGEALKGLHEQAEGHYAAAKATERHIAGEKKYQELIAAGATQEQALQGQHDTIQIKERKWQQQVGSLLTGRSGKAAISRAAAIAAEGFGGGGGAMKREFATLREQLASQHLDIKDARPMPNFGPRLPR